MTDRYSTAKIIEDDTPTSLHSTYQPTINARRDLSKSLGAHGVVVKKTLVLSETARKHIEVIKKINAELVFTDTSLDMSDEKVD